MGTFLNRKVDFEAHNEEVRRVLAAKAQGKPIRVPVSIAGSITNYFSNPELNTSRLSYEQFFTDVNVQIRASLEYAHYRRMNWLCDQEMGLPESWGLYPDVQNCYDATWAGCPLHFMGASLPDTEPILLRKEDLYDLPEELPVFGGLVERGREFFEQMHDWCRAGREFLGHPVQPPRRTSGEGTDGVLELAFKLRGVENALVDMMEDPDYFRDLCTYITRNVIRRLHGIRKWRWEHYPEVSDDKGCLQGGFYFADDAIALISTRSYREQILPFHREIYDAMSVRGKHFRGMHLCGDATRHFKTIVDELGVSEFDTGFPVDHGKLRRELGPEVQINGGPTVMVLKDGSPELVREETRRILTSGVMEGGRFTLIAANNLAPLTPAENIAALYDAAHAFGVYPD